MPSERIRLERETRREHQLEVFAGFKPKSKWERTPKS